MMSYSFRSPYIIVLSPMHWKLVITRSLIHTFYSPSFDLGLYSLHTCICRYFFQHSFICRPSDSTVLEDAMGLIAIERNTDIFFKTTCPFRICSIFFSHESLPLSEKINRSAKRCDKTIRTSYSCLLVILLGGDCEVHC
jgi:hypothetical protein